MQLCDKHWQSLRASVSKYGLDHLIAPDGTAAAEMMVRQFKGEQTALDFDPLMAAHNQLLDVALNFVGMKVMGDACPVCELEQYDWTEGAAYQSLLYAQKNRLMLEEGSTQ